MNILRKTGIALRCRDWTRWGAWIGDYSAYAASKNATVYAFEPVKGVFDRLCKTAILNELGKIIPVQKGLGDYEKEANPAYKVVHLRHKLFAAVPETINH
jgi:FkbM family methyltransferase